MAVTAPSGVATRRAVRGVAGIRWAMLRHTLRDPQRSAWVWVGTTAGAMLAAGTIWAAAVDADLLAVAMSAWLLGWIVGPLLNGTGDALQPTWFAATGLPPRRLMTGLLAGSLVGIGPALTLVAYAGLAVTGFGIGLGAGLVGTLAAVLQVGLTVAVAKLAAAGYSLLLRTRPGAALGGAITGSVLAFAAQGWAVILAFAGGDVAAVLAGATRLLPSGWGLVAVEAAGRDDPVAVLLVLGAVLALTVVAIGAWSAIASARSSGDVFRIHARSHPVARDAATATLASIARSVLRDPRTVNHLFFATSYAVGFCVLPLAIGWTDLLGWAGVVFTVFATALFSNQLGDTGTSLWLLLITPGAARRDVRARMLLFLGMVGPIALVLTVLLGALGTGPGQWAAPLSALAATLGAGMGITVLLSTYAATATTDPVRRAANPLDIGADASATGVFYLALLAAAATAIPAAGVAVVFGWWGLPVGIVTGYACARGLGTLAGRHIDIDGPDVLATLRGIRSPGPSVLRPGRFSELPRRTRYGVLAAFAAGTLLLFPQGLVPVIFLSTANPTRAWFFALYLPAPWDWLAAIAAVTAGAGLCAWSAVRSRAARQS